MTRPTVNLDDLTPEEQLDLLEQDIVVVACMHGKRHPRTWRTR